MTVYKPERDPMLNLPIEKCTICQATDGRGPLEHILEHMIREGFLKHGEPRDGQVTYMETEKGRLKVENELLPRLKKTAEERSRYVA